MTAMTYYAIWIPDKDGGWSDRVTSSPYSKEMDKFDVSHSNDAKWLYKVDAILNDADIVHSRLRDKHLRPMPKSLQRDLYQPVYELHCTENDILLFILSLADEQQFITITNDLYGIFTYDIIRSNCNITVGNRNMGQRKPTKAEIRWIKKNGYK